MLMPVEAAWKQPRPCNNLMLGGKKLGMTRECINAYIRQMQRIMQWTKVLAILSMPLCMTVFLDGLVLSLHHKLGYVGRVHVLQITT